MLRKIDLVRLAGLATFFVVILLVVTVITAQGGSDFIESATTITSLPYSSSQPIAEMTRSGTDPNTDCSSTFTNSIWYKYTPSVDQRVLFDANNSDLSAFPVLAVFSGTPEGLVREGCSAQAVTRGVDVTLSAGQTYYIMGAAFGTYPQSRGQFTLNVGVVPPVANDEFANATPVNAFPFSFQGNIYAATKSATDPTISCGGYASNYRYSNSVWFRYTASASQTVAVSAQGSELSSVIAVYTGSEGSLTEQAGYYRGANTLASFPAQTGTQYWIMVARDGAQPLQVFSNLNLSMFTIAPVANDSMSSATLVSALPFAQNIDVYGATSAPTDPKLREYCLYSQPQPYPNTIWYRYTPTTNHTLNISTDGSDYRTITGVYTLTDSTLSDYACSGDPYLSISVQAGVTYYVMIASADDYDRVPRDHSALAHVRFETPPVVNDLIEDATVVNRFPFTVEQNVYGSTISTNDPQGCTINFQSNSVWFKYTPTQNQALLLDASASDYRTAVKVYTQGTGSTLIERECAYGLVGMQAQAGTTYFIMISRLRNTNTPPLLPGDQLRFRLSAPVVSNDLLESPIMILSDGLPYTNIQDVTRASITMADPKISSGTCRSAIGYALDRPNTVWYQFTPTTTQTLLIDTSASDFPTYVELPEQGICGYGLRTFQAQAGKTYRIKVAYHESPGAAPSPTALLRFTLRPTVENDTQAEALRITSIPFTYTQDVTDATVDMGEPSISACLGLTQSVWFRYTATTNRTLFIDTSGSNYDTAVAIYRSSTVGECALVGNNPSNAVQFSLNVRTGSTYYFRIANYSLTPAPAPARLNLSITETTNSFLIENAREIPTTALSYQDIQDLGNSKPTTNLPFNVCNSSAYTGQQNKFWYRYTPTLDMNVTASSFVTMGDIVLNVYDADNMQMVTCAPGWDFHAAIVTFTALAGKSYYFFVGMDTHLVSDDSPWLNRLNFSATVNVTPTALTPSGVANAPRPLFTWKPATGAERYDLSLTPLDGTPSIIQIDAADNCTTSLCSFTPSADLPHGHYQWRVRGWHSVLGYTNQSYMLEFEGCPAFPYTVPAGDTNALITAITCANGNGVGTNDVINLTNSTYTLTAVNVTSGIFDDPNGLPIIVDAASAGTLMINGNGATIARSSASGTPEFRLFYVSNGANLTLNNLTLTGGLLSLRPGGVFESHGTLTLTNSTVSANQASTGGGIYNVSGTLTIVNSTISNNVATNSGGGIFNDVGSIFRLINSTVSGNNLTTGGSYNGGGGIDLTGTSALIINSTIVNNTAPEAARSGIWHEHGTLTIQNSIIANNNGANNCQKDGDTFTDSGNNLDNGMSCGFSGAVGQNTNPLLGALVNNGGPIQTHALQVGSPAIDAGSNAKAVDQNGATLTTDGRGTGFPRINSGTVDIGAYEVSLVNTPPTIVNITNKTINANSSTGAIVFTIDDAETPVANLELTKNSSNTTLVPVGNIVFGGSGMNRTVTVTPAVRQTGTATITVTVSDGSLTASDTFVLTVHALPEAIFSNGFESGSLSAWSANANDGGDLSVTGSAALMGGFGLQAVIDDTTPIYVTDDTPFAEPRYRARFILDPNNVAMATNDNFVVFSGLQSTSTQVLQLQFRFSSGSYQLRAGTLLDDGTTWVYGSYVTVTDAPHPIELDWQAAIRDGANNGSLTLWVDEVQQTPVTGLNNDTRRIDRVRLGAAAGIDAGTSGTIYFDAFVSRRQTYIGYLVAAPTLNSPADGAQVAREAAPTLKWNAVTGATQYYAEFSNGTTVSLNSGWISGRNWSPGLQPQGVYTWRVKARDASGEESAWSTSRTLTVRPGVPTNLQGTAVSPTRIDLTWTASVDAPAGITGYRIYREGVLIGSSNSTTPSFTDNAAVACADNHYKVRTIKGTVSSPDSTTITVNTSCDAIFSDGFESGNLSAWSANASGSGDLSVTTDAHLTTSTYGLQAVINDTTPIHVSDNTPNAEVRYRARIYFDPNSISMGTNETMFLFFGYQPDSTVAFRLQLRRTASSYQLRTGLLRDNATTVYGSFVNIADAPQVVEIDWQAASGAGANDGSLTLWVNDVQKTAQTGIDNDTVRIDRVRLGAVTGIQAGTSGTLYFDAFRSARLNYIGAEIGGLGVFDEPTAEPTAEVTIEPTAESTAEVTPDITPEATTEITPEATVEATIEPTAEITPEVTDEPTVEPTVQPTATPNAPTVEPTTVLTIEPTLLPFSVPVYQTMDDGAPLWSASAGWQLSADAAYNGLGWQVVASGNVETLALKVPVNLAGATTPTLRFQSKLVSGLLPEVRVSLDGMNWQTVASVTPSLNWALVTVDLSAYAGRIIQLQFVWATPAGAGDTWQVDEVTIADAVALPPVEPTIAPTEPAVTVTPDTPGNEPPVYIPTPQPREGGAAPDAPADLPPAPGG